MTLDDCRERDTVLRAAAESSVTLDLTEDISVDSEEIEESVFLECT